MSELEARVGRLVAALDELREASRQFLAEADWKGPGRVRARRRLEQAIEYSRDFESPPAGRRRRKGLTARG